MAGPAAGILATNKIINASQNTANLTNSVSKLGAIGAAASPFVAAGYLGINAIGEHQEDPRLFVVNTYDNQRKALEQYKDIQLGIVKDWQSMHFFKRLSMFFGGLLGMDGGARAEYLKAKEYVQGKKGVLGQELSGYEQDLIGLRKRFNDDYDILINDPKQKPATRAINMYGDIVTTTFKPVANAASHVIKEVKGNEFYQWSSEGATKGANSLVNLMKRIWNTFPTKEKLPYNIIQDDGSEILRAHGTANESNHSKSDKSPNSSREAFLNVSGTTEHKVAMEMPKGGPESSINLSDAFRNNTAEPEADEQGGLTDRFTAAHDNIGRVSGQQPIRTAFYPALVQNNLG